MKDLESLVKDKYENEEEGTFTLIKDMICEQNSPIELPKKSLEEAFMLEGETFVLKLHYEDLQDELKSEKIKYKVSQALSVIIRYEDDGNCFEDINKFVNYIHGISDEKQNSTFGVKKVKALSRYPISILFTGILPINQLRMSVGREIDSLIHSDDAYFLPRFQSFRNDISNEVGIPILPVLPVLDKDMDDFGVRLIDQHDGRIISEFVTKIGLDKDAIEQYLMKLFYIYKVLVEDKTLQVEVKG